MMEQVKYIKAGTGQPGTKDVDVTALGSILRRRMLRQAVVSYEANPALLREPAAA